MYSIYSFFFPTAVVSRHNILRGGKKRTRIFIFGFPGQNAGFLFGASSRIDLWNESRYLLKTYWRSALRSAFRRHSIVRRTATLKSHGKKKNVEIHRGDFISVKKEIDTCRIIKSIVARRSFTALSPSLATKSEECKRTNDHATAVN